MRPPVRSRTRRGRWNFEVRIQNDLIASETGASSAEFGELGAEKKVLEKSRKKKVASIVPDGNLNKKPIMYEYLIIFIGGYIL